ncbi:MAG: peptidase [Elusimicrobia bacterium]|nr:MAG: peptidase [Elusimicrobiota bacterium]
MGLSLLLIPALVSAQVTPEVIYGDDDRLDLHQVTSPKLLAMADSTVALFRGSGVSSEGGQSSLSSRNYGDSYNLCKDEPFRDQGAGAFCSGSLVGEDLIMTAGHCVRSQSSCETTKFVFGFGIKNEEAGTPGSVPSADVYSCKELLGSTVQGGGPDWALIRLDRKVVGHAPLKITRDGVPAKGTPLVVIGHPAGLPTKIAGGAYVRDNTKTGYFIANLDTYGGNSGSAVFNGHSGQIEGILVRGETDFVYDRANSCRRSKVCSDEGCRGEDVTNVDEVASLIPKRGPGAAFKKPESVFMSLRGMAATIKALP